MKRVFLFLSLMLISLPTYADALQNHYQRWACANTCTKAYIETETNAWGNRITYNCVACKYNFCMLPTGSNMNWEYNYYRKMKPGADYPFVYRWVKY